MIDEIKRRLEAGEKVELECINEGGFLGVDGGYYLDENSKILRSGLFVDKVSDCSIDILNCNYSIASGELQYFKIKENKKTFHDLVDVAVQAKKNGAISHFEWNSQGVLYVYHLPDGEPIVLARDGVSSDFVEDAIKTIKACYTETFVIESEEDISKVKSGAEVVLTNGCKGIVESTSTRTSNPFLRVPLNDCTMWLYLFSLKGATVTQRKTNN